MLRELEAAAADTARLEAAAEAAAAAREALQGERYGRLAAALVQVGGWVGQALLGAGRGCR